MGPGLLQKDRQGSERPRCGRWSPPPLPSPGILTLLCIPGSNLGVPSYRVIAYVRWGLINMTVGPLPRIRLHEKLILNIQRSFTKPELAGPSQFSQIVTFAHFDNTQIAVVHGFS